MKVRMTEAQVAEKLAAITKLIDNRVAIKTKKAACIKECSERLEEIRVEILALSREVASGEMEVEDSSVVTNDASAEV